MRATAISDDTASEEARVVGKVRNRLIWFLFVIAVAMFLDRINVAFAALTMNRDLGLSAAAYGLNVTFFSIGYILSEIPSNMLLARYGAKIWFPRIMITWGLASIATMFAVDAWSLYGIRFLVGLAEGGFLPGVFLYLSYWFPENRRARMTSTILMAQPITLVLAATVSGFILDMDGVAGLAGWRWLFLLEGLPSIVLGVVAFFVLTSKPRDAQWLSQSEQETLQEAIDRQDVARSTVHAGSFTQMVRNPAVLLMGLAYFGMPISLSAFVNWSPQIVRAVLASHSFSFVGIVAAIPPLCTVLFMPFWSCSSDRRMERTWHVVIPLLMAIAGWALVITASEPIIQLAGLSLSCTGSFAAQGIFFPFVTARLPRTMRPVGLAVISVIGIIGAAISPLIIGLLKDLTGNFAAGLLFVIGALFMSGLVFLILSRFTPAPKPDVMAQEFTAAAG